jgi:hypothetical protein
VLLLSSLVVLAAGISAQIDEDCWCARFVDLKSDVPTRGSSVFLRLASSAALTGAMIWGANTLALPNAQWLTTTAMVLGGSNAASALADLAIPTRRSIEADEDRIAASTLSESLCADTLAGYAARTRIHRYVSGAVEIASGLAQLLLLGPSGTYATGDIYDYVFLVTGAFDIVGGLIDILFSTGFERGYRDARDLCGT